MWKKKLFLSFTLIIIQMYIYITSSFSFAQDEIFGMRIENITKKNGSLTIITTGAKFIIEPSNNIIGWQRIPFERKVLELKFSTETSPFNIVKQDSFICMISNPIADIQFQGDSIAIIKLKNETLMNLTGLFMPEFNSEQKGKWLMIDSNGGFGVYPADDTKTTSPDFSKSSWELTYHFKRNDESWLSIFPPRPYNWERASQFIAHEGGNSPDFAYPDNKLIQSAAKYCKIFTIHAYFWKNHFKSEKEDWSNKRSPWFTEKHIPYDMKEFIRLRDEVHRNGMKLLVYLSPYYSKASDIFEEIKRVVDEYRVDGIYFDGISFDFRKSYQIIRKTRQLLGNERILYVHCSIDPFRSGRIYCPFIDTYADYILRGEAGRFDLSLDDFLRWTISGYNISNAVGYWCYYGSTGKPGSNPQIPTKEDIKAAIRNKAYIWRTERVWTQHGGDISKFDTEYYGSLRQNP